MASQPTLTLGLLPEKKRDWRTFLFSYSMCLIVVGLMLVARLIWPESMGIWSKYTVTEIIPRPDLVPEKPIVKVRPKVVKLLPEVKFEAPKLIVPKEMPKVKVEQAKIEPPKIQPVNFEAPKLQPVSGAMPAQIVHTGAFGSSATPTVNAPTLRRLRLCSLRLRACRPHCRISRARNSAPSLSYHSVHRTARSSAANAARSYKESWNRSTDPLFSGVSARAQRVAEKEAGGITQHIGAYHVEKNNRKIVFIDTPGHEAFTRMRSRGAKVTDIVVLVVAADDGVMPQTVEAMDHARAAGVPIVVAVNKIDKADAQPDRVKQQLSDRGLMPEEWGGTTVFVNVSAKKKQNLEQLLEMLLLVADMQELKANPKRAAVGTVLEARLDKGRGPVATILVQDGSLGIGDTVVAGAVTGKVRALVDDHGERLKSAGPSTPVEILGLGALPEPGDPLLVVTDSLKAQSIVAFRQLKLREKAMSATAKIKLEDLGRAIAEGQLKELPLVVKADVQGSVEAVSDQLMKIPQDKIKLRIIRSGAGAITEGDVLLAAASNAVVIGFNVRPERKAAETAERDKVEMRLYTVIYDAVEDIRKALEGLLEPTIKEVRLGAAEVREAFRISKIGTIAGSYVTDGKVNRNAQVRLLRDNVVIHTGKVSSLKRFKDDASEVKAGLECGIGIAGYNDIKPGDVIEFFTTEKVKETLA
jgi:translation initiation factor IF-2